MRKSILYVVVGLGVMSCNPKKTYSKVADEVSGAYTREYSFAIVNPESGKEIGMRTVRDTIFVQKNDNGYEVSNRKWILNDYDQQGWKNSLHADDRPISTYQARFDLASGALISDLSTPLYVDIQKSRLSKGPKESIFYRKITN